METTITVIIISETCCKCGVIFGLNKNHKHSLLKNGESFYCPNGHSQYYSQKQTLQEKIIEKDKEIQRLSCRIDLCEEKEMWLFCNYRYKTYFDNEGVFNIGHALKLGETGLLKIYGIGDVCIGEINGNLHKYNIKLKL